MTADERVESGAVEAPDELRRRPRCLVADDHPALTVAVAELLRTHGFEVIGPAHDGRRAVALAESVKPQLALVDYRMPGLGGVELVRTLRSLVPEVNVAVYTAVADEKLVAEVLEAGASAVVLKESPLADLVRALDAILLGRCYIDPAVSHILRTHTRDSELTPRERDVLRLIADGCSHEQIAARLEISPETVRTHLRKACQRLAAANRTQAVATAIRIGAIT
jgi:DNA-binding NarL/FixJ family response regulator